MNRRLERVNVASLRVAFAATAVFAIVYTVVAALIVVLVTNNLQSQIDGRLTTVVSAVKSNTSLNDLNAQALSVSPNGDFSAPPLMAWGVFSDGTILWTAIASARPDGAIAWTSIRWNYPLSSSVINANAPTTATIGRAPMRADSAAVPGGHVVAAAPITSVLQTRDTIAFTELLVGIVLLFVAFIGALYGGRRVGVPIEIARQRQMEFTADASHELRTPLSVIEAQTSLALAQDRDAAWYRSAFSRVGYESKRIRGLVEDLLWLARADSTTKEEHADPVEVGVLATQTVDRFAAVAESRGIRIGVTVGPGTHMVTGSPDWLDRLFGVLIDNACKYAPSNGEVRVSVMHDGHRGVRAVVEDSGPGIPDAERARIFERFHRAVSDKPGAGLGLAIADAVVRRTHGRWEVSTSAALGGASIGVVWPRTGAGSRDTVRADAPARQPSPTPPPA